MQDQHYSLADILALDKGFRRNLVNCLSGYKSLNLCGTISPAGQSNLSLLNSVVHIGANPPLMGMIMRPHVVERHTIENIEATGQYTLNMVSQSIFRQAHQASARYPRHESEFDATGLTPLFQAPHLAPYVKESPVRIGLSFQEKHLIQANKTLLIVGQIEALYLPSSAIVQDGFISLPSMKTVAGIGLDGYKLEHEVFRLRYAKPDQPPSNL